MISVENITKSIGAVTAVFAMIGGGYTLHDKIISKRILTWHPEHFSVSSGTVDHKFYAVVAREKHRDDCTVDQFKLSVKDSRFHTHPATASFSVFSGPASSKIDKFGFEFVIDQEHHTKVNKGPAKLMAYIVYKCPEGQVIVNYPDTENLMFDIH